MPTRQKKAKGAGRLTKRLRATPARAAKGEALAVVNAPPVLDIVFDPPARYLLESSLTSLQDFELIRLNRAANARKHLRILEEELRICEAEAMFARWLREHRVGLLAFFRSRGRASLDQAPIDPAILAHWLLDHREELLQLAAQKRLEKGNRYAANVLESLDNVPGAEQEKL